MGQEGPGLRPEPEALGLEDWARVARRYLQVEERLFEVMGAWVAEVPDPELKLGLRRHSFHHGWHADLWRRLAPARPVDLDGHEGASTGADGLPRVLQALAGPPPGLAESEDLVLERLVGVYRVLLPRLIAAYDQRLAAARPVADGPVARWLRFVVEDEVDQWKEGEAALQARIRTSAEAEQAARHQGRLEGLLAPAGIIGEGSPPGPPSQR